MTWVYHFCRAVTKSGQNSLLSGSSSLSERQKKGPAAREAARHAAWAQPARWHPGFGQVPPVSTHTRLCSRVGMHMLVLPHSHSGKKTFAYCFSPEKFRFGSNKTFVAILLGVLNYPPLLKEKKIKYANMENKSGSSFK